MRHADAAGGPAMWMIPLQTDVRMRYLPLANVAIIALTVIMYLVTGPAFQYGHHPLVLARWSLTGLVGHIVMHASVMHLVGNMIFLWVFGNAVNSRLGNLWYPAVYVGLGVATGLIAMPEPGYRACGASAAINGVIGLFIVLFPCSRLRLLTVCAGVCGTLAWLPSLFMAGLWFILDAHGLVNGTPGIGYGAHIAGFLCGVGLAFVLLKRHRVRLYRGERSLLHLLRRSGPDDTPDLPPDRPAFAAPASPPTSAAPAPSQFRPYRPTPDALRVRCACGRNVFASPNMAGGEVTCPGCGTWVRVRGTGARRAAPTPRSGWRCSSVVSRQRR